jgi:aryl-alcohol dehydrogenase-like predicted oxidoreductase
MRRKLGRTGLVVTPVGLGLAALGRPGYITLKHDEDLGFEYGIKDMESHAHDVLDAAWQAGIRYFDTARSYGRAESFLASWLRTRRISPGEVSVGSKWGYTYTADWLVAAPVHETKEHSLEVLRRQRQESEGNLGRYLRLYQIHSATLESGVLADRDVLAELARYRDEGLAIGLTVSGPGQSETLYRALEIAVNGRPLFECVQATWNILEPSAGTALEVAHRSGVGVIVKEALANGRLTGKNADPAFSPKLTTLQSIAAGLDAGVDAVAIAAALAQPWADVVLSGAAVREQLSSNLTAEEVILTENELERLSELAENPQEYWGKRSALPWN